MAQARWTEMRSTFKCFWERIEPKLFGGGKECKACHGSGLVSKDLVMEQAGMSFVDAFVTAEKAHVQDEWELEQARLRIQELESTIDGLQKSSAELSAVLMICLRFIFSFMHLFMQPSSLPLQPVLPRVAGPTLLDTMSVDSDDYRDGDPTADSIVEAETVSDTFDYASVLELFHESQ